MAKRKSKAKTGHDFERSETSSRNATMAQDRVKRPRDPIQLGKFIVDIATGEVVEGAPTPKQTRARRGGIKGGPRPAPAH